jgi:hypothetical protein
MSTNFIKTPQYKIPPVEVGGSCRLHLQGIRLFPLERWQLSTRLREGMTVLFIFTAVRISNATRRHLLSSQPYNEISGMAGLDAILF